MYVRIQSTYTKYEDDKATIIVKFKYKTVHLRWRFAMAFTDWSTLA